MREGDMPPPTQSVEALAKFMSEVSKKWHFYCLIIVAIAFIAMTILPKRLPKTWSVTGWSAS